MNEFVHVYGFGSYFSEAVNPRDIDLLIVHKSTERESCNFAILCKRYIIDVLHKAHIVMLSVSEEMRSEFIIRSKAINLGIISKSSFDKDLRGISVLVSDYRSKRRL